MIHCIQCEGHSTMKTPKCIWVVESKAAAVDMEVSTLGSKCFVYEYKSAWLSSAYLISGISSKYEGHKIVCLCHCFKVGKACSLTNCCCHAHKLSCTEYCACEGGENCHNPNIMRGSDSKGWGCRGLNFRWWSLMSCRFLIQCDWSLYYQISILFQYICKD